MLLVNVAAPLIVAAPPVWVNGPVNVDAPVTVVVPDIAIEPVPIALRAMPEFVAPPSITTTFCVPLLVVNVRSLLPRFTKRLPVSGLVVFVVPPRRTFALPPSLYVRPSSAPMRLVIGVRETSLVALIIRTSVPGTVPIPTSLRLLPVTFTVTASAPAPSPRLTEPFTERAPEIAVLPLEAVTMNRLPLTAKFPTTSSLRANSTSPEN